MASSGDWFCIVAKHAFLYLENDYKFVPQIVNEDFVAFSSRDITLELHRDQYSGFIIVAFFISSMRERIYLTEIVDVLGKNMQRYKVDVQINSAEIGEYCICKLADDLKESVFARLDEGAVFFRALIQEAQRSREVITQTYMYGAIREEAEQAWIEKDLKKMLRCYEKIGEDALTQSEKRRYKYARRVLSSS